MSSIAVDNARQEWEESQRRLEAAAHDRFRYERLLDQVQAVTDELRRRVVPEVPEGWLALDQAAKALGVARQTVLHKVQRGELEAVHVNRGKRKGLRIKVLIDAPGLFATTR